MENKLMCEFCEEGFKEEEICDGCYQCDNCCKVDECEKGEG